MNTLNRRSFLQKLAVVAGVAATTRASSLFAAQAGKPAKELMLSSQQYTWRTYLERDGISWEQDLDQSVAKVAQSGLRFFEPTFESPEQVNALKPLLEKHGLKCKSMYVNSELHDKSKMAQSIDSALAIVAEAKALGVEVVVTNPSPINWNTSEDKTDAQLILQADALNRLGADIRRMDMTLAYHSHDAEMRNGAREFHHMMMATKPEFVSLCLDTHWIYRGTGNSSVALFDIMDMYASRIVSVHLRQSKDGIWSETFGPGDIDYERVAQWLHQRKIYPQLILEQAVEDGSPHTLNAVNAHQQSRAYALSTFKVLQ